MTRKIEQMKIASVEGGSSRAHELKIHITFNEEAVEFLTLKGQVFGKLSLTVLHLLSIPKEVYDGDEYFRNKFVAESMRAVKSDYEDILELRDISPSTDTGKDLSGFTLCCDTNKLVDEKSAVCLEEAPPPEPEEDPV